MSLTILQATLATYVMSHALQELGVLNVLRPVFQFTDHEMSITFSQFTLATPVLSHALQELGVLTVLGLSFLSQMFLFNFFTGYLGDNCDQPCPTGTWGLNCTQSCACLNGARCHHNTGFCNCTVGYHGNINNSVVTCDHRFK